MNSSDAIKSNLVLDSDDDDEMDEIIAEFAEEEEKEQQVIFLSEGEDEIDDLIEEFAAAETDSSCENKADIPMILSDDDDDVLEAISEEFQFDCTDNSSTNDSLPSPLTIMPQLTSDNIVSKDKKCSDEENTTGVIVAKSESFSCTSSVNNSKCSVSETLVTSSKPCKNVSGKSSNEILSELKYNAAVKSDLPSSNSDTQKEDLTQNNNYVDKASNNTSNVRENILICEEDRTVYSSSIENLGESSSLRDGKELADNIDNSKSDNCSTLSELASKSSSDIMFSVSNNTTAEESTSDTVPESEIPCCTASVNSSSDNASITLIIPDELKNEPKENLANEITKQLDQDSVVVKVILQEKFNCVGNEINKTEDSISVSGVDKSHPKKGENLQCVDTKLISEEHSTTSNDESPAHIVIRIRKVNGRSVVVNHSIENIKSNINTLVSETEPLQCSRVNNSASDNVKTSDSVEPLNSIPDGEKSKILAGKKDGINSDSKRKITADNAVLPVCVSEITSTSERSSISERSLSRMAPEGANETNIVERSSSNDGPIHHESTVTIGDTQEDTKLEYKQDISKDHGTNAIVTERVLENGRKLLQINTKRKLEIYENEFSSKRQKEGPCIVASYDKQSSDIDNGFDSMKDANIEQLVSSVTVADIKAVDKINQLIPWNPSEKIETTKKTLNRIALYVCEETIKECYKRKYNQGKNEVKMLERKIEKLTKDLDNFRSLATEFSSSQKMSFANRCFEKVTSRTVAINVRIFKESEVLRVLEERKARSATKEKDSHISTESASPAPSSTDTVPKNRVPKVLALPLTTPVHTPVIASQASSAPATAPVPHVITDGDQLIPYLNPSKPPTSHRPPVWVVSVPTTVSSTCNNQIALQKKKPPQNKTVSSGIKGSVVDSKWATNKASTASIVSQQPQRSKARRSPSAGLLLFNHPKKDSPSFSCRPVPTSSPSLGARQTLVPLPRLQIAVPHLPSVVLQPASSAPSRPAFIHQPAFPVQQLRVCVQHPLSSSSQQHSLIIQQNQTSVHHQHVRASQQHSASAHTDSVSLQHLRTSASIHHNSSPARPFPSLPSDALTDKKESPCLPKPIVVGSLLDDGSVAISWNLNSSDLQKDIAFYQIYSKQENDIPDGPPQWKSVGDVASLKLPMSCTLNYFEENARYHFIVRVVDKLRRCGPFSDPVVIHYRKRKCSSAKR